MISIIIPNFNNAHYLKKIIECVIAQTYKEWELIVVDDQSTDDSVYILSTYAKNDKRIKFLVRDRLPKGGQTCRNIGFKQSVGEYVVFFDSDDLISENCLSQRVNFMEKNNKIDFGVFPAHTFSDELNYDNLELTSSVFGKKRKSDVFSDLLKADYQFTVWTNIYKRKSIENISWDENVMVLQDFDFNISCMTKNLKFMFCENAEFDYYYRRSRSNNSVTSDFLTKNKCDSTIYLFAKTIKLLSLRDDCVERKKEFLSFITLHFERLSLNGDDLKMKEYLNFCRVYYSGYVVLIMKIIFNISKKVKSIKHRKGIIYLFIYFIGGEKKYFKKLIDGLKF